MEPSIQSKGIDVRGKEEECVQPAITTATMCDMLRVCYSNRTKISELPARRKELSTRPWYSTIQLKDILILCCYFLPDLFGRG